MPILENTWKGPLAIPTYHTIHLIYNPRAGRLQRGGARIVLRLLAGLRRQGHGVSPAPTSAPGEARGLARRAVDGGADLVLVLGGDGTINEALNGVVGSGTAFAVLPGGTANVLATELGLPRDPEKAAAELGRLVPERISVGLLQAAGAAPRYFLMMAGIGLDAHIVTTVDLELKKKIGKLAYWIGGMAHLGRPLPQFRVHLAGESLLSGFTVAARVRNYGGDLEIARQACLLDDYFEMVAFRGARSVRYLKYLTGVLANLLDRMEGVTIRKVRRLEFEPLGNEEIFIQVDGELAGKLPATVEIVPDTLTLLMPAEFRQRFAAR